MTYFAGRLIERAERLRSDRDFPASLISDLVGLGQPRLRSMLTDPDPVFMHDWNLNRLQMDQSVRQALRVVS